MNVNERKLLDLISKGEGIDLEFKTCHNREIHRADELGSGMRKLIRYGKAYGGADPEMIEGDIFQIVVKVPEFGPASDGSVTPPVNKYIRRLLELLERRGALGNADIRVAFELKDRRRLRETYIKPALASGLIEMTIPEKPNSRLQKYRLTEKGRQVLTRIQGGGE